jgi:hypothetical protein
MQFSRLSIFAVACLLTITGLLAVGCSDDDKPVAPTVHYAWEPLGTGIDHEILCLGVYNNALIAGGWISIAGGVSVNGIAAWDGSAWAAVGSGIPGTV